MSEMNKANIETLLAHDSERNPNGAVVPPIFQNSLFTFENWDAIDEAFDHRMTALFIPRKKPYGKVG